MVKLSQIAVDPQKQAAGVWVPFFGDMELLIASAKSPEFSAFVRETLRPLKKEYRGGKIKEKQMRELMAPGVAKHLLRGWRGYTEDDGKTERPYSVEHATELLLRADLAHMYDFVVKQSREFGNFLQQELEDDLGN